MGKAESHVLLLVTLLASLAASHPRAQIPRPKVCSPRACTALLVLHEKIWGVYICENVSAVSAKRLDSRWEVVAQAGASCRRPVGIGTTAVYNMGHVEFGDVSVIIREAQMTAAYAYIGCVFSAMLR